MSVVGPNLLANQWALSHGLAVSALGSPLIGAGDPRSTRIVYAMVIGLALVGVLFVLLAVWVIRQTRVDLEMLAPLERMGDREWRKSDPASQRRSLDEVRPSDAEPLQKEPHQPRIDSEFDQSDRPVQSFDDLSPLGSEGADQTPAGIASDVHDMDLPEPDEVGAEADVDEAEIDVDEHDAEIDDPDVDVDEPAAEIDDPDVEKPEAGALEHESDEPEPDPSAEKPAADEPEVGEPEADSSDDEPAQRVGQ